ncbi:MAG: DUF2723 domain-containing protein [Bacteroidota bacterium]
MDFKKINNLTGWFVFLIATVVYLLTLEMTASFWDCGEFIAVSYKLMVPHPPGAPLFLLIGRMFSFLALGDVTRVAYWINVSSVLSSSFTILFLFWSITLIGRKILRVKDGDDIPMSKTLLLMGAGLVGSLAYTFSDSFWFSAVEAEVYAMSSFFTAFVFWAILKWELIEDESRANRWLILIAYMMGLSIGVHLLNLVTIPALGLIYYFKKHRVSVTGIVVTMLISGFFIILINNFIIPGLPSIAGAFDLTFVNSFGLPFGSGVLLFGLLLIGGLVAGIYYSAKKGAVILNTALLGLAFILIGYSSYAVIVIRSNFDPPIDENNPEDVMSFVRYLKREQYGDRPLLYGQYYTAQPTGSEQGDWVYTKGEEKYEPTDRKIKYTYSPEESTILPRIYSTDPNHQRIYREVLGLQNGEQPGFGDNVRFLMIHQLRKMYFRYFFWNFVGRDSDIQDAEVLWPWESFEDTPELLAKNRGRNNFLAIPLILGLIGLVFNLRKDPKSFVVVAMLFFLTGIALILYLNSPPVEPRERDYIYVGSFYAFAVWIGLSVMALAEGMGRFIKEGKTAAGIATIVCLTAPVLMATEGWNDHDRSDRYFSVDSAKNFLASCAPNAIIFTGGDNDTFPLWYVQEVEGFRTDVRVVVLSYFNTDWYVDQMTRPAYESAPFPFTLTKENYQQGGYNDYLVYRNMNIKNELDIKQFIQLIKNNHPGLKGDGFNFVPSKTMALKIDKQDVISKGIIPEGMDSLVVDKMVWNMKGNILEKKDLMILDILATNNWERPIYLNNTSISQIKLDLTKYAIQEGNAYRILPIENPVQGKPFVNTELMYENMMENFHYRELDNPKVYYNEDYRNFALNLRSNMNTLAEALIDEGKNEKARTLIFKTLERIPDASIPFDYATTSTVDLLFRIGEKEKAVEIAQLMTRRANESLEYRIDKQELGSIVIQRDFFIMASLQRTLLQNGEAELAKSIENDYNARNDQLRIYTRGRQ